MEPDASFVAADAYDQFVGRYAPQLAQELVAFAGVEAGMRALDVGCGPGGLTAVLADRLGAENVCGVEPSEPFAEACRARVPGVTVHVGAAELLPFDANSFDVALSQLVVNFMSDPLGGVREMARVTKPGGVVASCVWDYGGEMTMLRAFWDAAREIGAPGAAEADEADFAWCRDGELGELWRQAGLSDVGTSALVVNVRYADFDELWAPFPRGIGPAGSFTAALEPDRRQALRVAFRERLAAGEQAFVLSGRAWAARGTVA